MFYSVLIHCVPILFSFILFYFQYILYYSVLCYSIIILFYSILLQLNCNSILFYALFSSKKIVHVRVIITHISFRNLPLNSARYVGRLSGK